MSLTAQTLLDVGHAQCVDERLDSAVHDAREIVRGESNAVIRNATLRKVVRANLRRSVAGSDLSLAHACALRFTLGEQWLAVFQPGDANSPAGEYLRSRGEGPYEVVLSAESGAGPGAGELLPLDQTHGVRLRVAS